jgi:hypothetical protein
MTVDVYLPPVPDPIALATAALGWGAVRLARDLYRRHDTAPGELAA